MAKVKMPQLGESVTEGTIGRWLKKPGDHVDKYEPIVELITDKVNAEVPSPFAGTLTAILVEEGATVPNNADIAEIAEAGGAAEAPAAVAPIPATPMAAEPERTVLGSATAMREAPPAGDGRAPAQAALPAPPAAALAAVAEVSGEPSGRVTPAVRRLAREQGVDLSRVSGTGPGGRITRDDVLAFAARAATPAAAPAAPAALTTAPARMPAPPMEPGVDEELVPLVPMRRMIAEHMVKAKTTAPHAYTCIDVDMSGVVAAREAAKQAYQAREGIGLSFVPFVVKAVCEALKRTPNLNALWTEQGLLRKRHINVGIAVAVDDGLIVPVIHDADRLSIHGLNRGVNDLAARARTQQLKLDEVQGGTITVNNTGWFGSVTSQPIINVPQVLIVSMEAVVKRPVVIETSAGDTIGIRPIMALCASFDHRGTDGAQIGRFMQDVRRELESYSTDTPIW